jgi:hypothetical protein
MPYGGKIILYIITYSAIYVNNIYGFSERGLLSLDILPNYDIIKLISNSGAKCLMFRIMD